MYSSSFSPAFKQNNVPVVVAANNLYAPYTGVFIQSLLDHASEGNNYDIIILNRDISEENKRLLESIGAEHANISVRFYDPNPLFASFDFSYDDETRPFPIEVLYRIIAPHILNYPGRIITVDVDTLLQTDIARLMDADLEGCCVGGVGDVIANGMYLYDHVSFSLNMEARDYFQNVCGFGLDDLKNYVSAGLLLFDRDKYIRELDMETIINTARQSKYVLPEQDILNILMKDKIKRLDFAWNVPLPLNQRLAKLIEAGSKSYDGAYKQAYEHPYLLHWAGKPKPWVCPDVPYGNEWWQTALKTPFVGHIIARMLDAQEKRRAYYRERYGKEVDVWELSPKGIDRT